MIRTAADSNKMHKRMVSMVQNPSRRNGLSVIGVQLLALFLITACGAKEDNLQISALTHFKQGNAYYEQNRLKAAAEEYKRAIALDPDQDRFYYNLGLVYYSLNLYNQAVTEYWKAIERNSGFPEAWYNLALAFEKIDETEKAVMAYEKYQKLSKGDVESDQLTDGTIEQTN